MLLGIAMIHLTNHDQHEEPIDDITEGLDEEQLEEPTVSDLVDLEKRTVQ